MSVQEEWVESRVSFLQTGYITKLTLEKDRAIASVGATVAFSLRKGPGSQSKFSIHGFVFGMEVKSDIDLKND